MNGYGDKIYYDKDRVRKSGKYLYFWELLDFKKRTIHGDLSSVQYMELDCSIFRYKELKSISYDKSMGEGKMISSETYKGEWEYPEPNSIMESILNKVCEEHQ
tara:strand:+ start:362 stop:670 length:309 start_codon:yes stop_codon:yes gene_type:complete